MGSFCCLAGFGLFGRFRLFGCLGGFLVSVVLVVLVV